MTRDIDLTSIGFTLCPTCQCWFRKIKNHECGSETKETFDYYKEQQDGYYGRSHFNPESRRSIK